MCDHCHWPAPRRETRRNFLCKLGVTAVAAGLSGIARGAVAGNLPQVGHTGWARLVTPSPYWDAHSANDPIMADFVRRQTNLKIDPTCYPVEPAHLDQLCAFPFIFTNNLAVVQDNRELLNIREYLYRGGFLYIDACANVNITPNFQKFYDRHRALLPVLLPGCEIRRLPPDHPIFRAYFPVQEQDLTKFYSTEWTQALYGVFDADRMVTLLSLDTLQCGWPQDPNKAKVDMKQIANIYVYALAH